MAKIREKKQKITAISQSSLRKVISKKIGGPSIPIQLPSFRDQHSSNAKHRLPRVPSRLFNQ